MGDIILTSNGSYDLYKMATEDRSVPSEEVSCGGDTSDWAGMLPRLEAEISCLMLSASCPETNLERSVQCMSLRDVALREMEIEFLKRPPDPKRSPSFESIDSQDTVVVLIDNSEDDDNHRELHGVPDSEMSVQRLTQPAAVTGGRTVVSSTTAAQDLSPNLRDLIRVFCEGRRCILSDMITAFQEFMRNGWEAGAMQNAGRRTSPSTSPSMDSLDMMNTNAESAKSIGAFTTRFPQLLATNLEIVVPLLCSRKTYGPQMEPSDPTVHTFEDKTPECLWTWESTSLERFPVEIREVARAARADRDKFCKRIRLLTKLVDSIKKKKFGGSGKLFEALCKINQKEVMDTERQKERELRRQIAELKEIEKKNMSEQKEKEKREAAEQREKEKREKAEQREKEKREAAEQREKERREAAEQREKEKREAAEQREKEKREKAEQRELGRQMKESALENKGDPLSGSKSLLSSWLRKKEAQYDDNSHDCDGSAFSPKASASFKDPCVYSLDYKPPPDTAPLIPLCEKSPLKHLPFPSAPSSPHHKPIRRHDYFHEYLSRMGSQNLVRCYRQQLRSQLYINSASTNNVLSERAGNQVTLSRHAVFELSRGCPYNCGPANGHLETKKYDEDDHGFFAGKEPTIRKVSILNAADWTKRPVKRILVFKQPTAVSGLRPFAEEPTIDYDGDSDEEWEEIFGGEDLSGAEEVMSEESNLSGEDEAEGKFVVSDCHVDYEDDWGATGGEVDRCILTDENNTTNRGAPKFRSATCVITSFTPMNIEECLTGLDTEILYEGLPSTVHDEAEYGEVATRGGECSFIFPGDEGLKTTLEAAELARSWEPRKACRSNRRGNRARSVTETHSTTDNLSHTKAFSEALLTVDLDNVSDGGTEVGSRRSAPSGADSQLTLIDLT